jgi:hypothetical protein
MLAAWFFEALYLGAMALTIVTVALCVIRGVPVMIEGLRFFRKDMVLPKVW